VEKITRSPFGEFDSALGELLCPVFLSRAIRDKRGLKGSPVVFFLSFPISLVEPLDPEPRSSSYRRLKKTGQIRSME
jgi:hypothetical protein